MLSRRVSKKKRIVPTVIIVSVLVLAVLSVGGWAYHEQPRFCSDLCHIMDPYLQSWNGSDYGAGVHAAEGVTCLDCHEPTIQEQVNELTTFLKGDYTVPLEELEVSDEFCYDCHQLDEHENKDQVTARTAEMELNPHDSHLLGEMSCRVCHNMHKPSEDLCAICHDPVATAAGWITETLALTQTVEIQMWDPEMDCTVCKSMLLYVESFEDSERLAYPHDQAQEGLVCLDCHEEPVLEEVHEAARPDPWALGLLPRKVSNDFCLNCHIESEHTSLEQVIERTIDYTVDGEKVNPHDAHKDVEGMEDEKTECYTCHSMHKASRGIGFCYIGCHHENNFEGCYEAECHESVAEWKSMGDGE